MNISYDSDADLWRAYTKSNIDLWNQTSINGKYIIAYEVNPGLDPKVQDMLPKVNISGEIREIPGSNITIELLFLDKSILRRWRKLRQQHASSLKIEIKIITRKWLLNRSFCLNHAA